MTWPPSSANGIMLTDASRIWIPLQGSGQRPKAPAVNGWASPGYQGVTWAAHCSGPNWVGLRCDGLVVVDCDTLPAGKAWRDRADPGRTSPGYVRRTPRGLHFIYSWSVGSPTGPAVGVLPDIDIRASAGSQIVFHAPGYRDLTAPEEILPFNPHWLPLRVTRNGPESETEGWTEMPHGRGNNTLTAIAGAMRKQGMAEKPIRTILMGINKLTMTEKPMPADDVALIAHSVCRYKPQPDIDIEEG